MSSFRSHRIVIASLFLPTVAVIGESGPPTPVQDTTISAVADRLVASNTTVDSIIKPKPLKPSIITTTRQLSTNGPLKSIVEDLKDKVSTSFFWVARHSHSSSEPSCHSNSFTHQRNHQQSIHKTHPVYYRESINKETSAIDSSRNTVYCSSPS